MNEPIVPVQGAVNASQPVAPPGAATLAGRVFDARLVRRAGEYALDAAWRLRRLGPRRGSALVAALAAALAAFFVVWPMHEQASALQQQLAQMPAGSSAEATAGAVTRALELPRVEQLPVIVGTLLGGAQAAGLELQTGSYRLVPGKGGGPTRYEIALPVHGSYPGIRKFIESSLAAVPTLALDGLSLERPDVASSNVEVEVRFVVFVAEGA
jgi:hypothetical protein